MTKIGRPSIPKQERKAEFISVRLTPAERKEIEQSAERDGTPTTRWAREVLLAKHRILNPTARMITVTLNESELEILYRQKSSEKKKGGWQSLLVTLQELTNEETGEITLPAIILEKISRYAFDYQQGGWEDRLRGIFQRTLGPALDGNL